MPKILGITSLSDPEHLAEVHFDLAFSQAGFATQEALPHPPATDAAPNVGTASPRLLLRVMIPAGIVVLTIAAALLWPKAPSDNQPQLSVESRLPPTADGASENDPRPSSLPPANSGPTAPSRAPSAPSDATRFLRRTEKLLHQLEALEPGDLKTTRVHEFLTSIPLVAEKEGLHSELLQALVGDLPAARNQLIGPQGVHLSYYFRGRALQLPAADRAGQIRPKLIKFIQDSRHSTACRNLRLYFDFEFRPPGSPLANWCTTLGEINQLAKRG